MVRISKEKRRQENIIETHQGHVFVVEQGQIRTDVQEYMQADMQESNTYMPNTDSNMLKTNQEHMYVTAQEHVPSDMQENILTSERKSKKSKRLKGAGKEKADIDGIVERAIQGDKKALSELCENISLSVLYRVKKVVGNTEAAEDISQEVLIKVCRSIKSLREPKAFNGWLARIISNEKNQYFSKTSNSEIEHDIDDYVDHITETKAYHIPDEWLHKKELCRVISSMVSDLPHRQREAVLLHYFDGLTVTETAETMGVAKANVSTYIANAHKKLKTRLEDERHTDISTARATYSAGAVIAVALQQECMAFALANQGFLQTAAAICAATTATSAATCATTAAAAAAAGGATTAATCATTAAATTTATCATAAAAAASTTAAGTSGTAAAAATTAAAIGESTIVTIKVVAACLAATAAVTCGFVFGVPLLLPPEEVVEPVRAPMISHEDFSIYFYGGQDFGHDVVHVQPEYARLDKPDVDVDLTVEKWWISADPQGNDVLHNGDDESVRDALTALSENGAMGEYFIHYQVRDESGSTFTIRRNFYILESYEIYYEDNNEDMNEDMFKTDEEV